MPEDQVATYDEVRDLLGLGRIRGWYWLTAIVKQGILVRCRSQEDFGLEGVTLESLNLEARYWQEPKARSRRKRQIRQPRQGAAGICHHFTHLALRLWVGIENLHVPAIQ